MNKQTASQPILCIDLKKNRIRIHKQTLHMLGDPEYIQLLVNPSLKMIAIRCSCREDNLAHRIRRYQLTDGNCYEIYSTDLIRTLRNVDNSWRTDCSYRIYGNMNHTAKIAQFSMNDVVLVEELQNAVMQVTAYD